MIIGVYKGPGKVGERKVKTPRERGLCSTPLAASTSECYTAPAVLSLMCHYFNQTVSGIFSPFRLTNSTEDSLEKQMVRFQRLERSSYPWPLTSPTFLQLAFHWVEEYSVMFEESLGAWFRVTSAPGHR